ncbi:MAG: hypothetical protein AAGI68_02950 [Planctomycetota bacterium]
MSEQPHKLGSAVSHYLNALRHPDATPEQKSESRNQLAAIQEQLRNSPVAVRAVISSAATDVAADRLTSAEDKSRLVKSSQAKLEWFDADRLAQIDEAVAVGMMAVRAKAHAEQLEVLAQDEEAAAEAGPAEAADGELNAELAEAQAAQEKAEAEAAKLREKLAQSQVQLEAAEARRQSDDAMRKATEMAVQSKLAAAQAAFQQQNYRAVQELAADVLRLDAANAQALTLKVQAEEAVDDQVAEVAPIDVAGTDLALRWQNAKARYNAGIAQAQSARDAAQFDQAKTAIDQATAALLAERQAADPEELEELLDDAKKLKANITDQQVAQQVADAQAIARDQANRNRQANEDAETRRVEEIDTLIRQALELRQRQQYPEAIRILEQVVFIDPTNETAQYLLQLTNEADVVTQFRKARSAFGLQSGRQSVENQKAVIPVVDLQTYPDDWPAITIRRLAALDQTGGESEGNRQTSAQLETLVDAAYDQTQLDNIFDFIRRQTGANLAPNWPALDLAGVPQDKPITLRLSKIPAAKLLELVLDQASAESIDDAVSYSIIDGIVVIDTVRNLKASTDVRVYNIRDLLVQVPNFTDAPTFSLTDALSNTNSGGGGGGGGGGDQGIFEDEEDEEEDEGPTREELILQLTQLIQDSVGDPDEWLNEESTIRELNGSLIIKTTADNHRETVDLLTQLREQRAIQISVESRFLTVDQNFLEEFGIDIDARYTPDPANSDFGPIQIAQDSITLAQRLGSSIAGLSPLTNGDAFDKNDSGTGRSLSLGVSFLDDLEVDLLVNATLANQRSTALNAPRVTFFNGQRAYVVVARQIAFVSDLEPVPDAAGFDVTVSVVSEGVVLDVEGTTSADRRYVTLTVRPSLADVDEPLRTFPVSATAVIGTDDGTGQPITTTANIEVPEVAITTVRATVSVPDRGTLLLGGQRIVNEAEIEAGVPVLSKVPVLNRLFTNTSTVKEERTLLILVKPTIVIQNEEEDLLYPGLRDDPDSFQQGR